MKHESMDGSARGKADRENRPVARLRVGSNRSRVNLELIGQGRDYLLLVTGGEAHVGAVAVWDCAGRGRLKAVNQLSGHREGPLAGQCAEILGRAFGRTVVAVVGIHQDHATPLEIEAIVANVGQGAAEMVSLVAPDIREQRESDD